MHSLLYVLLSVTHASQILTKLPLLKIYRTSFSGLIINRQHRLIFNRQVILMKTHVTAGTNLFLEVIIHIFSVKQKGSTKWFSDCTLHIHSWQFDKTFKRTHRWMLVQHCWSIQMNKTDSYKISKVTKDAATGGWRLFPTSSKMPWPASSERGILKQHLHFEFHMRRLFPLLNHWHSLQSGIGGESYL